MIVSILTYILDDNHEYLSAIKDLLQHEGIAEVRAYSNPDDMIQGITEKQGYVFVIDHDLRTTTGLKVIESIRQRSHFHKIIVVSGTNDIDIVVSYANAGIRNYVVKGKEIFNLINYVKDAHIELLQQIDKIRKLREGVEGHS